MYVSWAKKDGCAKEHPSQSIVIILILTLFSGQGINFQENVSRYCEHKKSLKTQKVSQKARVRSLRLSLIALKNALNYGGCR